MLSAKPFRGFALWSNEQQSIHHKRFLNLFVHWTDDALEDSWRHLVIVVESKTRIGIDFEQNGTSGFRQKNVEAKDLQERTISR